MKTIACAVAALVALLAGASTTTPALAQAGTDFTQPIWSRVYSITPRCRANPDFPIVGRVAGYAPFSGRNRLSWVGCFPNMAECQAWRRFARGQIVPPIQQNTCEPRF